MFFQLRYRFPVSGSRPSEKDLSADGDVIGKLRCTNPRGGTGGKCGKSENCLSESGWFIKAQSEEIYSRNC